MLNAKIVLGAEAVLGVVTAALTGVAIKKMADLEKERALFEVTMKEERQRLEKEESFVRERTLSAENELKELKEKIDELASKKRCLYDHEKTIIDGASKLRNATYSKDDKTRDALMDEGYSLIENTLNDIKREINFKKKFGQDSKKYEWLDETRKYILEKVKIANISEEQVMADMTLTDREKELLRWMLQA